MATTRETYKTQVCKVLLYDPINKSLDVDFCGYGIRFNNIDKCKNNTVSVKYKGNIGTNIFTYRLG